MSTERLRRPCNLKPCHEIRHGLTGWVRVVSVERHPHMENTWTVQVRKPDGSEWPALLSRPILSRLACNTEADAMWGHTSGVNP